MPQSNVSERIARAMQQRLLRAFHADLSGPPERIVIGFSGGADSLALVLLLMRIAPAIPSKIEVLHIDHRLRPDSGDDAEAARALAASIGAPFRLRRVSGDVRELHPGVGLEEAARRERYRLLAAECGAGDVVALAHHAQDQAETVLLHLMRGSGLRGAAGMPRLGEMTVPWWDDSAEPRLLRVWRPLLAEQRPNVRAVARAANLHPVEDPSNDDIGLRRNAVRHRVIPVLESIEPGAIDAVARFAAIAQVEDRYLDRIARDRFARISDNADGIDVGGLQALDFAIGRRVALQWLEQSIGETPALDRVDALIELAQARDESRVLEIAGARVAGLFGNVLRCGMRKDLEEQAWLDARLGLPLSGWEIEISVEKNIVVVRNTIMNHELHLPGGIAPEEIRVRPLGNELIAGLQLQSEEWFRRERISPWIRSRVQGVAIGERMWWVPRMSDDYGGDCRMSVRWVVEESS